MLAAMLVVAQPLHVAGPCEHKAYLSDASVADKKAFEATVRLLRSRSALPQSLPASSASVLFFAVWCGVGCRKCSWGVHPRLWSIVSIRLVPTRPGVLGALDVQHVQQAEVVCRDDSSCS